MDGKRSVEREVTLGADRSSNPGLAGLPTDSVSPSGHAIEHEQAQALERALARLTDEYRQVVLLRYQEKKTFEEIGQIMGRTPNAARKLWLRAVERLQQELERPP